MATRKMTGKKSPPAVTPVGEVMYAWLDRPRPPYEESGKPKYTITIALDRNLPEVQAFGRAITDGKEFRGLPYEIDAESGLLHVKFGSTHPPRLYDSEGKILASGKFPGKGSKVKVAYVRNEYTGFGGGVNLYLSAVQVIEMVEGFGGAGYKFEKVDGGYVDEGAPTENPADTAGEAAANEARDDKMPF